MKSGALLVATLAAVSLCSTGAAAQAAGTGSAVLTCGHTAYAVTGFGRGEVLHVLGSHRNYVVTFARLEPSGRVVTDIRGQRDRTDIVTCTASSPGGSNYTFKGFFTPRGA